MNEDSIAHTKWNCKYHIVFTPKYRRKAIYGQLKADIGKILRELCTWKEVEIIEATVMPDHIHIYVFIPPKISVAGCVEFLKGRGYLFIKNKIKNCFSYFCIWTFLHVRDSNCKTSFVFSSINRCDVSIKFFLKKFKIL